MDIAKTIMGGIPSWNRGLFFLVMLTHSGEGKGRGKKESRANDSPFAYSQHYAVNHRAPGASADHG